MKAEKRVQYTNKYANKWNPGLLRHLMHYPIAGLAVHWLFQSMLYMDPTERRFKLAVDILLTGVGGLILSVYLPWHLAGVMAFLIAHTINFLFNAHFWVVLKHYGLVNNNYRAFTSYVNHLTRRIQAEEAGFVYAAIYGSLVRADWQPSSDLDLRLVRRNGWHNGIRANLFTARERTHAFLCRFPLDVYVLDNCDSLNRLDQREIPIILLDERPNSP